MAWWLVDSIINGTLDEDYPIMNKKDDVVTFGGTTIAGGEGTDTLDIKGARNVDWGDDGFSITGNPTASPDTINIDTSVGAGAADTVTFGGGLPGGAGSDHIDFSGVTSGYYPRDFGDDPYPTLGSLDNFKPQPDLKRVSTLMYQDD